MIKIAKTSLLLGIALFAFYVYVFCVSCDQGNLSWDHFVQVIATQLKCNIGDFLWGTLGIAFTFTTTIFLFITFKEQREQLKETKDQSDKTRFETTYFNILGMLKPVQDTVNANIAARLAPHGIANLVDYYRLFQEKYIADLDTKCDLRNMNSAFDPLNTNSAEIEQYEGLVVNEYEEMIGQNECNIGYLYRYLFNTIKFVIDDRFNQTDIHARDRYLNLLQAQLSNEELCFIFYNALSKYGKDKEGTLRFRQMLDDTHFLENIDPTFLLNRNHFKFYPKTAFKFLNRTELEKVTA